MAAEFLRKVMAQVDGEPTFERRPWYNPYGDCLVFHVSEDATYADRVDEVLTLYRSIEDDGVVGFQIKGVQAIMKITGSDTIAVSAKTEGGNLTEVALALLLIAGACKSSTEDTPRRMRAYAEAGRVAGEQKALIPEPA